MESFRRLDESLKEWPRHFLSAVNNRALHLSANEWLFLWQLTGNWDFSLSTSSKCHAQDSLMSCHFYNRFSNGFNAFFTPFPKKSYLHEYAFSLSSVFNRCLFLFFFCNLSTSIYCLSSYTLLQSFSMLPMPDHR